VNSATILPMSRPFLTFPTRFALFKLLIAAMTPFAKRIWQIVESHIASVV
jgi:hypothetical protein